MENIKVGMDIAEIKRTVYGRDMREPIADACEILKRNYEAGDARIKRISNVDVEATSVEDYYTLVFT